MASDKENSGNEYEPNSARDVEKLDGRTTELHKQHGGGLVSLLAVEAGEVYEPHPEKNPKWYQKLLDAGVEENGVKPVLVENRTNTQYSNLFTVFFTSLLCLLP